MKIFTVIIIFVLVFGLNIAQAERLAISADVANIRAGPGTGYDVLWKVEKYHPIIVLDKSDSWYLFQDFEGDKGWVHQSLTGKIDAIITKSEISNIRSGPGSSFNVLFKVEKGIPFKVLNRKDNWIQIQHADGDMGWIHSSLVW